MEVNYMSGKKINRRVFLKSVSAAVAVPYVIDSSAIGTGDRAAPSDRIVMGAIGTGNQGKYHIGGGVWVQGSGFVNKPQVQFAAVCDVNRKNLHRARDIVNKKYGNKDCATYSDFRQLLGRADIDAVLVATPDHWHVLASIAAAGAGKDIYCEKPVSLTIRQARVAADIMKRYGRIFQTGTQQRSSRQFRFACELVRNGYIGEIKSITVNVGGGPRWSCDAPAEPEPDFLDWNFWLGPAPWRPYTSAIAPNGWSAYRDYSGGGMTNWGAHMFDIAQWAMGMDESGPVEIFPPDGKDYEVLTYKYANGTIMTRDKIGRDIPGVLFVGTTGKIEVSRKHLTTQPENLVRQKIAHDEIHLYKSKSHQDNFLQCVRSRQRPASDAEVGCRSVTVCHLGNIAYWLKRPLKWDPKNEHFVNDPEADQMMSRPMRAPWRL